MSLREILTEPKHCSRALQRETTFGDNIEPLNLGKNVTAISPRAWFCATNTCTVCLELLMFTRGLNGLSIYCTVRMFSPLQVWIASACCSQAPLTWCASGSARRRRMSFAVTRTGSAAAVVVKLRRGERVKAEPVRCAHASHTHGTVMHTP